MFAGSFVSRVRPAARSEPFRIVKIDFSSPGNRPCHLPAPLAPPRARRQGRRRVPAPRFLSLPPRLLSETGPGNALRGLSFKRARWLLRGSEVFVFHSP